MSRQFGSFTVAGRPTYVCVAAEAATQSLAIRLIERALDSYARSCA